jgi:hypothetical protein
MILFQEASVPKVEADANQEVCDGVFLISKREIFREIKKAKELRGGLLCVRRTRNSAGCHRDCEKGLF